MARDPARPAVQRPRPGGGRSSGHLRRRLAETAGLPRRRRHRGVAVGNRDPPAGEPPADPQQRRRRCRAHRSRTGRRRPGAAVGRVRRHRPGAGSAVAGDARRYPGCRAGRPFRQGSGAAVARTGEQREDQALPGQGAPASRPSGGTVMTGWHLDEATLRRYVGRTDSLAEGASVEQHLLSCGPCRARITPAADVIDLAAVWDRTRDAVEVPRPTGFERLMRAVGLPANEARLVAVASAFRGVWLTGAAAILAFATLAAAIGHARGLWLFIAVAPVVPCLVVASSYDPWLDPALEPELVTPYPALRLILLRTIAVLALALPAVLLLGLVIPGEAPFAWLLPAVGFVAVVLAASTWVSPLRAAIAVSSVWLAVVSLLATGSASPGEVLQARGQAGFTVLAAASFVIFLVRRRRLRQLRPWR